MHLYTRHPTPVTMTTVVVLSKAAVKQLAEADMQEVVKEVREIYIDYLPIGGELHKRHCQESNEGFRKI